MFLILLGPFDVGLKTFSPSGDNMCTLIWVVGREESKWTLGKYLKKIIRPFF